MTGPSDFPVEPNLDEHPGDAPLDSNPDTDENDTPTQSSPRKGKYNLRSNLPSNWKRDYAYYNSVVLGENE